MMTMMIKEMINGQPETERKSSLEWMKILVTMITIKEYILANIVLI